MYVYMLTDTLSEDVPELYGSQKRALAELQRRFKETLDDAIYLTDKDKETLKKDFKKTKHGSPSSTHHRKTEIPCSPNHTAESCLSIPAA